MGCSGCIKTIQTLNIRTINTKFISNLFDNIDKNIINLDLNNKIKEIYDFNALCQLDLPNLENLNLSNNKLSDISELKSFKVPNLKILDLSYNNIKKFDVFKELDFILEELNLIGNEITYIGIFEQANCLKKLKKLRFDINDNEYETNINILSNLKESIKDLKFEQKHKKTTINRLETLHLNL